eukprot:Skav201834  [mRNA]  locus=scaffold484:20098:22429:+ [translate_table: standard]
MPSPPLQTCRRARRTRARAAKPRRGQLEEAADPVAEAEADLTDSAARRPGGPASSKAPGLARVKTGPQMVRRKVPRWARKPSGDEMRSSDLAWLQCAEESPLVL